MKSNTKYEYDLVGLRGNLIDTWATRESARIEKRDYSEVGIKTKIIQKKYQLIEIKEVR